MSNRSDRLRVIESVKGSKIALDLIFWTYLEDTIRYFEEKEVAPSEEA